MGDESRDFGEEEEEEEEECLSGSEDFQESYQPQTPTADLDGPQGKQYDRTPLHRPSTGGLSPVEFDIDNLKLRLAEAQQFSTTAESEVDRLRTKLAEYEGDAAHRTDELARELDVLRQQLKEAEASHLDAQRAVEAKQVQFAVSSTIRFTDFAHVSLPVGSIAASLD